MVVIGLNGSKMTAYNYMADYMVINVSKFRAPKTVS